MISPVVRRFDWSERLIDFIEQRRYAPFEWGRNDCIMFAADAVIAMTDSDLAQEYRETYGDARGAMKLARSLGGIETIARSALWDPKPWAFAQRGDVVLVELEDTTALGICIGTHVAGPGNHGAVFLPMQSAALKAWTV